MVMKYLAIIVISIPSLLFAQEAIKEFDKDSINSQHQIPSRSLLISLWKVSDQVTQKLMVDFYANWLGGMSKREALKKTQLTLKEKFESPFYWGAFVLVGE
jgi:hypothetical protein